MRGHRDLALASLAAIACALISALAPWEIVRLFAAVPLTLVLPGYAIIAAAFASRELAPPKRWMLSVATSLMILVLSAFLLNIFPFGLRTASWAVLLPLVVVAACRGAALRRSSPKQSLGRKREGPTPPPTARSVALVSAALLIGVVAIGLAQRPLPAENAVGYAALWMLPADAREDAVVVGVINNERRPASYRLEVELGKGGPSRYKFKLDPGAERTFEFDLPSRPGRTPVAASLYRQQRPGHVYRRVTGWLPRVKTFPR